MKILLIVLIILKTTFTNFQTIEKFSKCLSPSQNINLKASKTITTEFALLFWIRSTHYHSSSKKPFFKITNTYKKTEKILKSSKSGLTYKIYSNTTEIGSIPFSNTPLNTFQEEDFITKKQIYNNWYFIGISFYNSTMTFFINGDLYSLNLDFTHVISDVVFYHCFSDSNSLGGLYFADLKIFFVGCWAY